MLAEISANNPKRTALKHPLTNTIMAKKDFPSAASASAAIAEQISDSATITNAIDVNVAAASVSFEGVVGITAASSAKVRWFSIASLRSAR